MKIDEFERVYEEKINEIVSNLENSYQECDVNGRSFASVDCLLTKGLKERDFSQAFLEDILKRYIKGILDYCKDYKSNIERKNASQDKNVLADLNKKVNKSHMKAVLKHEYGICDENVWNDSKLNIDRVVTNVYSNFENKKEIFINAANFYVKEMLNRFSNDEKLNGESDEDTANNQPGLVHAQNLRNKLKNCKNSPNREVLQGVFFRYALYLWENENASQSEDLLSDERVRTKVKLLNKYYNYIRDIDADDLYSPQTKYRPSILEEFFYLLFHEYIEQLAGDGKIHCGAIKAYTNLFIKADNFNAFAENPNCSVNRKDQDFAVYKKMKLFLDSDGNKSVQDICVPVVAIECKTFLDKTMLDGAIAAADKVKMGFPFAQFFVATEAYDVGLESDPTYSRIDQIYVLRKMKRQNKENGSLEKNRPDIDENVVWKLVVQIKKHLKDSDWSNPQKSIGLEGDGQVIRIRSIADVLGQHEFQ